MAHMATSAFQTPCPEGMHLQLAEPRLTAAKLKSYGWGLHTQSHLQLAEPYTSCRWL